PPTVVVAVTGAGSFERPSERNRRTISTPRRFFFSSRRRHTSSVSAFLLNRSSDLNIIGSREGSRNRRRLKANQTGKKFRVGIKSNISTNRNNLISGVDRCIHLNAMKKTTITSINRQTIKI